MKWELIGGEMVRVLSFAQVEFLSLVHRMTREYDFMVCHTRGQSLRARRLCDLGFMERSEWVGPCSCGECPEGKMYQGYRLTALGRKRIHAEEAQR